MPSLQIQNTIRNAQGQAYGESGFSRAQGSVIEIVKTLILPDAAEVQETTAIAGARVLWVFNQSTVADNTLMVGLATGVYIMEIPPNERWPNPLVGKPNNPTLFFKFTDPGGGALQYGLWD